MKKMVFPYVLGTVLVLSACNQSAENHSAGHDSHATESHTESASPKAEEKSIAQVAVVFTDVDAQAAASIKEVVDHYLHVKNALVNDNSAEAASGANAMEAAIGKVDKSLFKDEQKKAYDVQQPALQQHASALSTATDIKVQREHFVGLSNAMYELVKSFGAGRPLYHEHCPMARDNQGALWISESNEVKNPYFGASMLTCGSVKEEIK